MLSAAGVTIDSIGGVWLCLLACCWLLWCFICAMLFGLVDYWFGVMDSGVVAEVAYRWCLVAFGVLRVG